MPGMELPLPGRRPHGPASADSLSADAIEEPAQKVDPDRTTTAPVASPAGPQLRHPLPQRVRHGRRRSPWRRRPLALSPDPAVVDRVLEHLGDAPIVEAELVGDLPDRQSPDRAELGPEPVQAPRPIASLIEEAEVLEDREVLGDRRPRHCELRGNLGDTRADRRDPGAGGALAGNGRELRTIDS